MRLHAYPHLMIPFAMLDLSSRRIRSSRAFFLICVLGLVLLAPAFAAAQLPATGAIAGRVASAASGNYLNNARVRLEGTTRETLTDRIGQFRFDNVPAGETQVRVFYTGLAGDAATVTVEAGKVAQVDFNLVREGQQPPTPGKAVQLDKFVVEASREITGAAIAINEQRFAPNIRTVVAADEFGDNTDGNPGEFLKFLAGVTADTVGSGEPRVISVRGIPSSYTVIQIDGFRLASASSSNQSRTVELDQVTINNMSRIEVAKSQTPDSPADAIGGAVNMVSKSALERKSPLLTYRLYVDARNDELTLAKTAGPGDNSSRKINPGFDFSYLFPVSQNFGFAITGVHNVKWGGQESYNKAWFPNGQASASGQTATTADNPYLERYEFLIGKGFTTRDSLGLTLDFKPSPNDILSFTFNEAYYHLTFDNRDLTWDTGSAVTAWGQNFTQGGVGKGSVSNQGPNSSSWRDKRGTTWQPSLTYHHYGPTWKIDGGLSYSHATNHYRDIDKGFFQTMNLTLSNLTVRYDNIRDKVTDIATTTAAGAPIDTFKLNNYRIVSAATNPRETYDEFATGRLDVSRSFDFAVPVLLKAGGEIRQQVRDITVVAHGIGPRTWNFVGADGIAGTADDLAGQIIDDSYTALQESPYGLPHNEWPSPYKLYQIFKAHPEYFTTNDASNYQAIVNGSMKIQETVSSAYLRADVHLMSHKLWLVGGVRFEQTQDKGDGPLQDNNAKYQHDSAGRLILDGAGKPILIPGLTALQQTQLIFRERATHAKHTYSGYFPSLNATYNFSDDLLLRAAYGRTLARPDYNNIIPGFTVADPTSTTPKRITVRNTALKPWTADSFDLSLEYYFKKATGVISLSAYQRNITNFFSATVRPITPADRELYGLDPTIYTDDYEMSTTQNVGNARLTGVEFNYKQNLTFLPQWASGLQVFANGTFQHVRGTNPTADFSGFIEETYNAGVSLSRPKYGVKLNWNHKGRQRQTLQFAPDFFNYAVPKDYVDANLEFRLRRNVTVFLSARNILSQWERGDRYNSLTPGYAQNYNGASFSPLYTLGVRGTF